MKKAKVLSMDDELYNTARERVTIMRDPDPLCPYMDWDTVFAVWSNIPREMRGSKDAYEPLEEEVDEEGYGTGKWKAMEGHYVFPVSAYIHSGISLSLGTIREFSCDPGGWDTTPNALLLYTTRERYESMCGKGTWRTKLKVPGDWESGRVPVESEDEWEDILRDIAESEVHQINLYLEGSCFGYKVEKGRKWKKTYEADTEYDDGRKEHVGPSTEEGMDYEETDSCWGCLTDDVNDIDFPKEEGLPVFADEDCDWLEGKEYEIPEFVVTIPPRKEPGQEMPRFYLSGYAVGDIPSEYTASWTTEADKAVKFNSWWQVQQVAQKVIRKEDYSAYRNCREIDKLKAEMESEARKEP